MAQKKEGVEVFKNNARRGEEEGKEGNNEADRSNSGNAYSAGAKREHVLYVGRKTKRAVKHGDRHYLLAVLSPTW